VRYFFDTEFIEDGKTIDLLSIGIVAEDCRELYLCNQDAKLDRASEWVIWNVYPHLSVKHAVRWYWTTPHIDVDNRPTPSSVVVPHYEIRDRVRSFLGEKPEIWGYFADYDWVVFCQLFGCMIDLPKGWPMYCRDVKQLCDSIGNPKLPEQSSTEHHALNDARWTKQAYEFLMAKGIV
jgi:hypothetical protein